MPTPAPRPISKQQDYAASLITVAAAEALREAGLIPADKRLHLQVTWTNTSNFPMEIRATLMDPTTLPQGSLQAAEVVAAHG